MNCNDPPRYSRRDLQHLRKKTLEQEISEIVMKFYTSVIDLAQNTNQTKKVFHGVSMHEYISFYQTFIKTPHLSSMFILPTILLEDILLILKDRFPDCAITLEKTYEMPSGELLTDTLIQRYDEDTKAHIVGTSKMKVTLTVDWS